MLTIDPKKDRRSLSSAFALVYGVVVVLAALNRWSWGLPLLFTLYSLLFALAGVSMTASNASANALLLSVHLTARSAWLRAPLPKSQLG